MHGGSEFLADADNDISEHGASSRAFNFNAYDLLILNAELSRGIGSQMDMSLCNYYAFGYFNFSARTDDLTTGCSGKISGFSDNDGNTDASCISRGKFDLSLLSDRAENGDICDLSLGTYNGNSFIGGELPGLGKIFLESQFKPLSEKNIEIFAGR